MRGGHTQLSFILSQQKNLQYELITADKCSVSVKLQERRRRKWSELKSNLVSEITQAGGICFSKRVIFFSLHLDPCGRVETPVPGAPVRAARAWARVSELHDSSTSKQGCAFL